MCPSYRGTLDERHATRGRGNALRLAISGQLNADGSSKPKWDDEETIKTLDLCLGCKACKSECPSNVDIARLKAEYTAQRFKATGRIPLAAKITGHVRWLNKLGAMTPGLANWFNTTPIARALINAVMKMHPKRSIPKFSRSLYAELGHRDGSLAGAKPGALRVAIYADCFTTYNESRIGLAMDSVLRKLGYAVDLPRVGCCGRSMISMGMLEQAIEQIDRTIEQLRPSIEDENVRAIVFAEPSCLSAVKDDWLTLKCASSIELRKKLAAKAMLVEDFVDRYWDQHPAGAVKVRREALPKQAILHAHCHQKALWGGATSARVLRRLLGDALATPDTGCCGMCGAFGYDRDKYELSMKIGNLSGKGEPGGGILPIARGADAQAVIVAPGTSCRHQIKDGADREAIHPIELVDRMIK
jgi:Fe-S oxidoreductase